jgi:hypothetical protein
MERAGGSIPGGRREDAGALRLAPDGRTKARDLSYREEDEVSPEVFQILRRCSEWELREICTEGSGRVVDEARRLLQKMLRAKPGKEG